MDYIRAFLAGGVICALAQILKEKTKMMPGRIMVLLVVSGAILGAIGIYEPFKEWAGAGASVPLLGFGNTVSWALLKAGLRHPPAVLPQPLCLDTWHRWYLSQR